MYIQLRQTLYNLLGLSVDCATLLMSALVATQLLVDQVIAEFCRYLDTCFVAQDKPCGFVSWLAYCKSSYPLNSSRHRRPVLGAAHPYVPMTLQRVTERRGRCVSRRRRIRYI
ncbi:hypothetical protein GGR57DRAFT_392264 [Xylariaceae sp. FL1272]|nr:hypothetical protein GGR57DRAFT_392264 [Xylariaceae sp. FL1272]